MRQKWLSNLLVLLIALQSVVAIAGDIYLLEPSRAQTLEPSHEENSSAGYRLDGSYTEHTSAQYSVVITDQCLDCNLCYCCAYLTLPAVDLPTSFDNTEQLINGFESSLAEAPCFSLLRPPKA